MTEPSDLQLDAPVVFVNWYEAEAWCRWAKRRLPTEAEWEAAAIGEPGAGGRHLADVKRVWPWGEAAPTRDRANLDFAFDAPLEVAACGGGDSAFGCRQMVGNVWEWTASDFAPFPGFSADPYEDYSQPWFGTRKVLRGGCWATSARIARPGYRNFFPPIAMTSFLGSGPAPLKIFQLSVQVGRTHARSNMARPLRIGPDGTVKDGLCPLGRHAFRNFSFMCLTIAFTYLPHRGAWAAIGGR